MNIVEALNNSKIDNKYYYSKSGNCVIKYVNNQSLFIKITDVLADDWELLEGNITGCQNLLF